MYLNENTGTCAYECEAALWPVFEHSMIVEAENCGDLISFTITIKCRYTNNRSILKITIENCK